MTKIINEIESDKMTLHSKLFQPFYDYLEAERQALLTKLDRIERLMGISPRTAEIRRRHNSTKVVVRDSDSVTGVKEYK